MSPEVTFQVSQAVDHTESTQPPVELNELDTTGGSLLHHVACRFLCSRLTGTPSTAKTCIAAIALTYLPLFLAAVTGELPVLSFTSQLRLPFLYDCSVAFMFLVCFPTLVILTVRDQSVLVSSLKQVHADGVLVVPNGIGASLYAEWNRKFRKINLTAQLIGLLLGGLVAEANYITYRPQSVGYWTAADGRFLAVGYVYLYCVYLFYALMPIYVLRNIGVSLFLKDLVAHSEIRELPFHPDQSGGLRPVGDIGLRNQYCLTVAGVNVVLLIFVSYLYLKVPPSLSRLIAAAALAYLTLGPVVFIGPLLPFRAGMLRTKTMLMSEVAQRLRIELQRVRQELKSGVITKEDEDLVDRLRKLGSVIDQLPVWPFNSTTLRKFLSAYITPLLGAGLIKPLVTALLSAARH